MSSVRRLKRARTTDARQGPSEAHQYKPKKNRRRAKSEHSSEDTRMCYLFTRAEARRPPRSATTASIESARRLSTSPHALTARIRWGCYLARNNRADGLEELETFLRATNIGRDQQEIRFGSPGRADPCAIAGRPAEHRRSGHSSDPVYRRPLTRPPDDEVSVA